MLTGASGRRWRAAAPPFLNGSRRAVTVAASVAALAAALGACSSGHVVASNSGQFYVRVPTSWKLYDSKQLLRTAKFAALISNPPRYLMAASAAPHPSASQAFSSSKYPWAILLMTSLGSAQQSSLSLGGLSDVLVNVDQLNQQGVPVQPLQQGRLLVRGALRGTKVAYGVGSGSQAIDYQQETWVNAATNKLWVLMVGCSPSCYQARGSDIGSIVQSFYVSDKGTR